MMKMPVKTISGYDPIVLTVQAEAHLQTSLKGHLLATLINPKLTSGELVASFQLLNNGVYGYVVDKEGQDDQ